MDGCRTALLPLYDFVAEYVGTGTGTAEVENTLLMFLAPPASTTS